METDNSLQTQPNSSQPGSDSKNFALITWIGMIFLGFWVPLIIYLVKTDDPFVRGHAKSALNWWITAIILLLIGGLLTFVVIGVVVFPIVAILNFIFGILGAIAASNSKHYAVPLAIKFLK